MPETIMLQSSEDRQLTTGDFDADLTDAGLVVPKVLHEALVVLNMSTLQEFISILQSYPTALAEQLGWTVDEVQQAAALLYVQLHGHVPPEWLEPPAFVRKLGAFPPESG